MYETASQDHSITKNMLYISMFLYSDNTATGRFSLLSLNTHFPYEAEWFLN